MSKPKRATPLHSAQIADIDAERGVLGAVLHDNKHMAAVIETLDESMFFLPQHQRVFAAMRSLWRDRLPIDELVLGARLKADGITVADLAELVDVVPVAVNARVYADVVVKRWQTRQAILLFERAKDAVSTAGAIDGTAEDVMRDLSAILTAGRPPEARPIREVMVEFMEWMDAKENTGTQEARTYIPEIDKHLGGISHDRPLYIAARTSTGKTTVCAQIARMNAERGIPTLYVALEERERALAARMLSARSRVTGHKIIHRKSDELSAEDWDALAEAAGAIALLPLYILRPQHKLSVPRLEAIIKRYRDKHGVRLAVVDHIKRIAAEGKDEYDRQSARAWGLAEMQTELDMPLVVAAQINRQGDDVPNLTHLEGSGAIEQSASAVVILHDRKAKPADKFGAGAQVAGLDAIVAKNDAGEKNVVVALQDERWRYAVG